MEPVPYPALLGRNLRIARAAADISQEDVSERMRALGFSAWLRSTVSLSERGKRRIAAEEVFALAICLETSASDLMSVAPAPAIALPGGQIVGRLRAAYNDGSVKWDGNVPVITIPAEPQAGAR